jgi:hypothetical protein
MSFNYQGLGEALVIRSKCTKLIPFTSSSKITFFDNNVLPLEKDVFSVIEYKNSFNGSKKFSVVKNTFDLVSFYQGSDVSTNITFTFFRDEQNNYYNLINITGMYKKCNYSLEDLQILLPSSNSSASVLESLKKNSKNSDELHKLLDKKPNLKKIFLKIKAKLGK